MKKVFLLALIVSFAQATYAQSVNNYEKEFETDTVILNRIEKWKDLKFGFMMHWGIYSQWGVVESWSICNEPWITRNGENYVDYVKRYQDLNKTFNPEKFNPEYCAEVANKAGMKYVVFTTKHHDGFCMFDTKETSYSITDKSCPFSSNPKADITAEVVKEFRKKNFWIGLYFSKPDWHCKDYWAPQWATPDRNVNYDIDKYPERWQKYCDFTFNQIKEEKSKTLHSRLAATQWKTALTGNVPMQIFLGKQYLGQSDKIESKNEIKNDVTFKIGWEDADDQSDSAKENPSSKIDS